MSSFLAQITAIALSAVLVSGLSGFGYDSVKEREKERDDSSVKNIIIMIADGWGYNHITAADYYQVGEDGTQIYEDFPSSLAMSTFSIGGSYDPDSAWNDFNYVRANPTDSAAAATAMATGEKTYNGAIGVDYQGEPIENVFERAEMNGKSTGVVTSVQFSHATPAGFATHNANRGNYEEIAKEMIHSSSLDVIMGTGNPWYNNDGYPVTTAIDYKYVGGKETWDSLVTGTAGGDADGDGDDDFWTLIETRGKIRDYARGDTPKRVIAVAQVFGTLNQARSGDNHADPYEVPLNASVPTLVELTKAALNVLDEDPDGFVLMIEGGAIDWASHSNQSGRMIEELIDYNKAVEAVVKWVNKHSNWGETLLIVTGDHETGYLSGPGSNPGWEPIGSNGKGNLPSMAWYSGGHTNSLIPFFAKGKNAHLFKKRTSGVDDVRGKYIDNTEIAKLVFELLDNTRPEDKRDGETDYRASGQTRQDDKDDKNEKRERGRTHR